KGRKKNTPDWITGMDVKFKQDAAKKEPTLATGAEFKQDAIKKEPTVDWDAFSTTPPDKTLTSFPRGHLIAESFGGPNEAWNIVPMLLSFNTKGRWKKMERELSGWLETYNDLSIKIEITYGGQDLRVPTKFSVKLKRAHPLQSWVLPHVIIPPHQILIPESLK